MHKNLILLSVATGLCVASTTLSATRLATSFTTTVSETGLSRWQKRGGNPEDFAIIFYSLVLANEALGDDHIDYQLDMARVFFTPSFYKLYEKAYEINKKIANNTRETACIDYRVLSGGNDIVSGFQVQPATVEGNKTIVPINGGIKALALIKTAIGWRIDDIINNGNVTLRSLLSDCSKPVANSA